jgi:predicted ribosome quality control (RQC) complex YloA/Tae2 family protein
MDLDVFTLAALVDEFMDVLVGGRIQDSIDVDATGIGLEIYADRQRRYLYISADHLTPRVHLVAEKLRRGVTTPKQIGLLLRRYVEGGVITHVSQPAWERILHIDVQGPEGDVTIIIEPMERRSNILLVQAGVILDCMRRVGPEENRYRLSLPAHEYVPPPPQTGKLDPTRLELEDVYGLIEQNADPKQQLQRLLSARLLGVSPLLAKEIVFRAGGQANARTAEVDAGDLYDALQTVITPLADHEWHPGVAEGAAGVEAFSVYPLLSMAGWQPVDTVSEALAAYYGAPVGEDAYNAAKAPVEKAIDEATARLEAKLASLERSVTDEAEREMLRKSGELILAYQYTLQGGQTELRAHYEPDEPELVVQLDTALTPLENAQRYFTRYEKARRALDDVPQLIEETRAEINFLAQLKTDLALASNWPDIDEVQQALQSRGYWRGRRVGRVGGGKSAPMRMVTPSGFVIWVGRNSRQNEIVTFDKGGGADLWLHARDVPGAHVVVKFDGRPIPEDVIQQAAEAAAYFSARRGEARVIVDVTECKYVRKIKGTGPGMVTYRNETTRTVAPRLPELEQS